MANERRALVKRVSAELGRRALFWFGTRGDDARSLSDIPQFSGSFTILNRYAHQDLEHALAYEDILHRRVDLDSWDIDNHLTDPETRDFRRAMLRAMSVPHAVVPYRPSDFLSALAFARQDTCLNLGLFSAHQHVFEHKPWVETAVREMEIPSLDWRYIADEEQPDARRLLAEGPIVVRPSRGSGGSGMAKVTEDPASGVLWSEQEDFFASVSHYYADCPPLNVGAVVWRDGVTVHWPSFQLVGIPSCVARPFGYCGNDFAAVAHLDPEILDQIEESARNIGRWLHSQGYKGAFGVDYMLDGGTLRFTEVNPRFQGSTRVASRLSVERQEPCILVDHIAAMLGFDCPVRPPLRDIVPEVPPMTNLVVHNTTGADRPLDSWAVSDAVESVIPDRLTEVRLPDHLPCEKDATVACFTLRRGVTTTGYDLAAPLAQALATAVASLTGPPT